mmetsp:Transcript_29621/g.95061  ORF Transcript_29621/g.95061 Transcript_29621/m.95061 type:complete len:204 (-) Transcript_29621:1106-1717(-)
MLSGPVSPLKRIETERLLASRFQKLEPVSLSAQSPELEGKVKFVPTISAALPSRCTSRWSQPVVKLRVTQKRSPGCRSQTCRLISSQLFIEPLGSWIHASHDRPVCTATAHASLCSLYLELRHGMWVREGDVSPAMGCLRTGARAPPRRTARGKLSRFALGLWPKTASLTTLKLGPASACPTSQSMEFSQPGGFAVHTPGMSR